MSEISNADKLPIINTDSRIIRRQRGINQFELEQHIPETMFRKSVIERYFVARDEIFAKLNNNTSNEHLISDNTPKWPVRHLVGELYLPAFVKLIDSENDRINQLKNPIEKSRQGFRLSTINYLLGIMIHQAYDGNGQTNRVTTLSYIWEHCPEYKNKYFPIKYTRGTDKKLPDFQTLEFQNTPLPENMTENDKNLIQTIRQSYIPNPENPTQESETSVKELIKTVSNFGVNIPTETTNLHLSNHDYLIAKWEVASEVEKILEKKYKGYFFGDLTDIKSAEKSVILSYLLNTPNAIENLKQYIQDGSINITNEDILTSKIFTWALDTLHSLDHQFREILEKETIEKHTQEYQENISLQVSL